LAKADTTQKDIGAEMTGFEPERLTLSEEEVKLIYKELLHNEGTFDWDVLLSKLEQYLFVCRLARNPKAVEDMLKGMQDVQNGNIKKVQLRERD
jgi:hypothetical protein